ncbi:hypothetical protein [Streptomyces sp. NBC_00557]|uniref:hypothetical protein n=1 Tax=Streptomyces sp. NBC_00557 TaxID=2975776 RepID=UPI002E81E5A1|nr:hypothetical protein [Streptomyces sp. NBC_00557]WUC36420.1 hypothetical protein OG956_20425 [Streptomyces sp. NBC_00557]
MPSDACPGSVRSAHALNSEIRQLWRRSGGRLSAQDRSRYEQLVTEWAAALRRESAGEPGQHETALALP